MQDQDGRIFVSREEFYRVEPPHFGLLFLRRNDLRQPCLQQVLAASGAENSKVRRERVDRPNTGMCMAAGGEGFVPYTRALTGHAIETLRRRLRASTYRWSDESGGMGGAGRVSVCESMSVNALRSASHQQQLSRRGGTRECG